MKFLKKNNKKKYGFWIPANDRSLARNPFSLLFFVPKRRWASLFLSIFSVRKKEEKITIFEKNRKSRFLKKFFLCEGIGALGFLFQFQTSICLNFSKKHKKKFYRNGKCKNFDDFCELLLKKTIFPSSFKPWKKKRQFETSNFIFLCSIFSLDFEYLHLTVIEDFWRA